MSEQQNGDWYCRQCGYLPGSRVTYSETCDTCHTPVEFHTVAEMSEIESLRQQLAAAKQRLSTVQDKYIDLAGELHEARAGRVPEGWKPVPLEPTWGLDAMSGAGGEQIPSEVARGLAGSMACDVYRAMVAAAPQPPTGRVGLDDWSKTKPASAGAYRVRGFDSKGTAALVEASRDDDGELRCNIHERNSDDR